MDSDANPITVLSPADLRGPPALLYYCTLALGESSA